MQEPLLDQICSKLCLKDLVKLSSVSKCFNDIYQTSYRQEIVDGIVDSVVLERAQKGVTEETQSGDDIPLLLVLGTISLIQYSKRQLFRSTLEACDLLTNEKPVYRRARDLFWMAQYSFDDLQERQCSLTKELVTLQIIYKMPAPLINGSELTEPINQARVREFVDKAQDIYEVMSNDKLSSMKLDDRETEVYTEIFITSKNPMKAITLYALTQLCFLIEGIKDDDILKEPLGLKEEDPLMIKASELTIQSDAANLKKQFILQSIVLMFYFGFDSTFGGFNGLCLGFHSKWCQSRK